MVPLVVSVPVFATGPVIVPPFARLPALPRPAGAVRLAVCATVTAPALVERPGEAVGAGDREGRAEGVGEGAVAGHSA